MIPHHTWLWKWAGLASPEEPEVYGKLALALEGLTYKVPLSPCAEMPAWKALRSYKNIHWLILLVCTRGAGIWWNIFWWTHFFFSPSTQLDQHWQVLFLTPKPANTLYATPTHPWRPAPANLCSPGDPFRVSPPSWGTNSTISVYATVSSSPHR